jgi:hypothetical protein
MNFLTLHSTKYNRRALQELLCTCRNGQGKYTMCFRQHERHSPRCKRLGWAGVRFLRTRGMRTTAHPNLLPAHSVEHIV